MDKKQYYTKNKEKILERQKEYRKKNKDRLSEQKRKYCQKNKNILSKKKKEWYQKNKDRILKQAKEYYQENKDLLSKNHRKYYQENKKRLLKYYREYYQKYYQKNKDLILERQREYCQKNRYKINKNDREKNKKDLKYNLNNKVKRSISHALKDNKNGRRWEILVGYTVNDLIKHLQSTMPKGYDWQDVLEGRLHIDHIIPISVFNFTKPEHPDFKRCWALENLQLLPAKENILKNNKIYKPFQPSLILE